MDFAEIERRVVAWAADCPEVRAIVVMGSRARTIDHHPADEWSDLDLIVFAHQHETFVNDAGWLGQIAPVWIHVPNRTVAGDPELLTLFEGGLQVVFVLVPYDLLRQAADSGFIQEPYRRGARAIVDKENLAAKLIPATFTKPSPPPLPGETEYWSLVDAFWFIAYYIARRLRRGDRLMAHLRYHQLHELIVRMAEWYARATRGTDVDTWHSGRFVEDWSDPRVLEALGGVFPHYDADDWWRSLSIAIHLFTWLAQQTAARLILGYPSSTDSRLRPLLLDLST